MTGDLFFNFFPHLTGSLLLVLDDSLIIRKNYCNFSY